MSENTKKRGGGPRTSEGKLRSSANSLKHGFTSKTVVMNYEDPRAFERLHEGYLQDFRPASNIAADLVFELAVCQWRLRRVWAYENDLLNLSVDHDRGTVKFIYKRDLDEPINAALAFDREACHKTLPLLRRYEAQFTRRTHQILAELKALGCFPPVTQQQPEPKSAARATAPAKPVPPPLLVPERRVPPPLAGFDELFEPTPPKDEAA